MTLNAQRALAQYLEDLKLAGVTHLPRSQARSDIRAAAATAAPPGTTPAEDQPRAPTAPPELRPASTPAEPRASSTGTKRGLFAELEPPAPSPPPASAPPVPEPSTMPLEERRTRLAELATCVAACTRCRELADTRTQTVFGVGDPEARILFIGEAPGADEDRQGEPFVGKAGQLLDKIIAACRIRREDVYICNVLKCRPPGNRTPTSEEAANCREHLDGQIAVVDPDYIVCWGSVAAQNLLGTTAPIGRLRGRFYTHGRAKVLCTYHPSYLLRTASAKKDVWDDMKFLFRDMGVELS